MAWALKGTPRKLLKQALRWPEDQANKPTGRKNV